MEESYQIEDTSIVILLNKIDKFKDKIDLFIEDHTEFMYDIDLEHVIEDDITKWVATLSIIKNE